MDISSFDLNLVRVFASIARHRSITAAGQQLGLSQSSVSHSLRRLRSLCGDPLFVRTAQGMQPTAFALRLAVPFETALESIRAGLENRDAFDAGSSTRRFRLLLSDVGQVIYLPRLAEHLGRHARGVRIEVVPLPLDAYRHALEAADADAAIGHLPMLQGGFHRLRLFDDPYVCFVRRDHPSIGATLRAEQYFAATHVVVDPPGRGPGLVERALSRSKRSRDVVLRLPHYFAAPLILQRTEHVLSAPRRLTAAFPEDAAIRVLPLPFRAPKLDVSLYWHERVHHDPGHRWLRALLARLFAEPPRGRAAEPATA